MKCPFFGVSDQPNPQSRANFLNASTTLLLQSTLNELVSVYANDAAREKRAVENDTVINISIHGVVLSAPLRNGVLL